jgi:hypothetical protein
LKLLPVTVGPAPAELEGSIAIELGDGVRARVDGAVDEATLGPVLRALSR